MEIIEESELVTLSSTHPDLHGDKVPTEVLENMARQINGPLKGRVLINHRRDIPPIGYWDEAIVVKENDHYLLKARQIFFKPPSPLQNLPGLIVAELNSAREFLQRPVPEKPTIYIDRNNYPSYESAQALKKSLEKEFSNMAVEIETRKHAIPDPQIAIILSDYWHMLQPLLVALGPKIGDAILEETIGDAYKSAKKLAADKLRQIVRIVRTTRKNTIPRGKTQIIIFEIPGTPYIELYTKTDDVDLISRALGPSKIKKIKARVNELSQTIKIKEVRFILDKEGNWKFNYILTEGGNIIGNKDTIKKRDKLITYFKLHGKGYSISGIVKYNDNPPPTA